MDVEQSVINTVFQEEDELSDSDEDSDDSDDASSEYDYHFNEWSYI